MSKGAQVVSIDQTKNDIQKAQNVNLESGRRIKILTSGKDDVLEIIEPAGEVVVQIKLTPEGPIITAQSAHLKLTASDTLTLESKRVEINSECETVLKSKGNIEVNSDNNINLQSQKDVKIEGELIHLN